MYFLSSLIKILHFFPEEFSHHLGLRGLKLLHLLKITKFLFKKNSKTEIYDRDIKNLPNNIGFAAGLDKNGEYIDSLAALGVSFIEVGTVTPRPQKGNSKPRIFRNRKEKSLINRLGFNNKGVNNLIENLKNKKTNILVGSSIGKNFDTPNDKASDDYLYCLERVYEYSDYIAINISSPNTQDLRELSKVEHFDSLLKLIKTKQKHLAEIHGYKPILIKISPDESTKNLKDICNSILTNRIDGIICSNTSIDHDYSIEKGGISGKPLKNKATECLRYARSIIGNELLIIASGGVMNSKDYIEKIDAGANLVQIYTGFIFEGPKLIQDVLNLNSTKTNT